MAVSASSSIAQRSAAVRNGMPSAVCSASNQPEPMPKSRRPPLITSTVVAIFASTAGWRYVFPVTSTPSRSCSVSTASAASAVHASRQGSNGSIITAMKWS